MEPLLLWSVRTGPRELVQTLLDNDADANQVGEQHLYLEVLGMTPLMQAIRSKREDVFEMLLCAGARVHAMSRVRRGLVWSSAEIDYRTPLMYAAEKPWMKAARRLIELGAGVDAKSGKGETALTLAAERGAPELVTLLLESGAKTDVVCFGDSNARIQAGRYGHPEVAEMLAQGGAPDEVGEEEKAAFRRQAEVDFLIDYYRKK